VHGRIGIATGQNTCLAKGRGPGDESAMHGATAAREPEGVHLRRPAGIREHHGAHLAVLESTVQLLLHDGGAVVPVRAHHHEQEPAVGHHGDVRLLPAHAPAAKSDSQPPRYPTLWSQSQTGNPAACHLVFIRASTRRCLHQGRRCLHQGKHPSLPMLTGHMCSNTALNSLPITIPEIDYLRGDSACI